MFRVGAFLSSSSCWHRRKRVLCKVVLAKESGELQMRRALQRGSVLLGGKPEPFSASHKDALSRASSVPALRPANPTGYLGPSSLPWELSRAVATYRVNTPACTVLPGLPSLALSQDCCQPRSQLHDMDGARAVWLDPHSCSPDIFAVTSPDHASSNCPSCCLYWEEEKAAGPTCPEPAPAQEGEGEVSRDVGSRASPC